MTTKLKVGIFALLLVVSSGAFAASASLSGSVDRTASADVVTDDAGLISLQDGAPGGLVYQNSSGALTVDFTNGSATGVNSAAHYEIGDTADANNTYAFNVTNLDNSDHSFTFDYTQTTADSDPDSNIQFQVYDDTGTVVGTADEEGSTVSTSTVAPGTTFYVVVVVDTHGLDSSADLSGSLSISV